MGESLQRAPSKHMKLLLIPLLFLLTHSVESGQVCDCCMSMYGLACSVSDNGWEYCVEDLHDQPVQQISHPVHLVQDDQCEGTMCPGGCCPEKCWFCNPDSYYCCPTAADCP